MYLYEMCDEKLRTNNERRTTTVVNVNQFVKNNGPCFNLFILSIICVVDDGILYFLRRRGVCCVCVPVVGLAFSWPPWLIAHGGVIVLLSPPDHIVILAHVSIGVRINIRGIGIHKFSRRIHFGGGGGRSGGGRRFVFTGRG